MEEALWEAWGRVVERVRGDSGELGRRLPRRRMGVMMRPPRAWCLALRACDTRINIATALIVPEDAVDPGDLEHRGRVLPHRVEIDAQLLRTLCRAVRIEWPGEDWRVVGRKLGRDPGVLRYAMKRGVFEITIAPFVNGKQCRRVPVLWSGRVFDPSAANLCEPADPLWGAMWPWLADMVPDDLLQSVERVPVEKVWRGQLMRRGWRWICPGCRKQVRTVFYPLPPVSLGEFYGVDVTVDEVDERPRPPGCFACKDCHGVQYFSRTKLSAAWNLLVTHMSGGLLYGSEVPQPEVVVQWRKRAFVKRPRRKPSRRRAEVEKMLAETTLTYRQIAAEMGVGFATVHAQAKEVYRERGVHGREQLRRKMGLSRCASGE